MYDSGAVTYDAITGEISFNAVGRYTITWWLATQSSDSLGQAFSIESSEGDVLQGASPAKTGQLGGFAVIEALDDTTLVLRNTNAGAAYYSSTAALAGSLIVVQDDDVTPASGNGAIIPFASGATPVILTSIVGGLAGLPSYVGFGTAVQDVNVLGIDMLLTGLTNMAFSVPHDGIITDIAAYFSNTLALSLLATDVTVRVQLYQSTVPNNNFSPLAGTEILLSPTLSGVLAVGAGIATGELHSLNIDVAAGTRLLLVSFITVEGVDLITNVTGNLSAGVTIAPDV